MTEPQQSQRSISAAFPAPPPFWKHFTPANVAKLEELKETQKGTAQDTGKQKRDDSSALWNPSELHALEDVPRELRYLIPPSAPTEGTFEALGEQFNVTSTLPTLESQGITRLYSRSPSPEPATASTTAEPPSTTKSYAPPLLKLSKSLLLNFLEYVSILCVQPSAYTSKLDDIRTLFINMHHLINEYRPHQARESLILLMEEQIREGKREIEEMDKVKGEMEAFLEEVGALEAEMKGASGGKESGTGDLVLIDEKENDRKLEDVKTMWEIMHREFGQTET